VNLIHWSSSWYAWRLDRELYQDTWDCGMGAYKMWGRWNPPGRNVVYASVDPSTDILEAAQVGGMTGGKNGA
jgi:RES domain-containing protein